MPIDIYKTKQKKKRKKRIPYLIHRYRFHRKQSLFIHDALWKVTQTKKERVQVRFEKFSFRFVLVYSYLTYNVMYGIFSLYIYSWQYLHTTYM